jgi:hypothetical protein
MQFNDYIEIGAAGTAKGANVLEHKLNKTDT